MAVHEHVTNECPQLSELLLADSRELPGDDLHRIDAHVAGCVSCRAQLRYAGALVRACGALEPGGRTRSASMRVRAFRRRKLAFRRLMPLAAAIATILIIIGSSEFWSPTIRAEELLARASVSERSIPLALEQVVRVQFTSPSRPGSSSPRGTSTTVARRTLKGGVNTGGLVPDVAPPAIAEALRSSGFDFRRPLSVTPLQLLRAAHAHSDDTITHIGDLVVLRTTTSEGLIREAELTVRGTDFHVVALRLTFLDLGKLEIEELQRSFALPRPATPLTRPSVAAPTRPALSRWLEHQYTFRTDATRFVGSLESAAERAHSDLRALRDLGERFPQPVFDQLGADQRADIERQAISDYERVRTDLDALNERLGVLFGRDTFPASSGQAGLPPNWRVRAEIGLDNAVRLNGLLKELLKRDDLPPADDPIGAPAFSTTFGALWAAINGLTPLAP